ncbi:MAG: hypothetical protein PVF17_13115 [Ignavibacteria bacterium]|jgi:hypothetical protein
MKTELRANILKEVEEFSDSLLLRKTDLQILIDESLKENLEDEFEELAFTGKYVEGLKRILKKGKEFKEIENLDYVKKDLSESTEKVIDEIRSIIKNSSDDIKKHFEENYLTLTVSCYQNLNELTANLELVKKYLNYQKRSD